MRVATRGSCKGHARGMRGAMQRSLESIVESHVEGHDIVEGHERAMGGSGLGLVRLRGWVAAGGGRAGLRGLLAGY